jgi:hypothetical protein
MKIKLKESIRANGVQYLPPAVVDTDEIGITQADADVLVRRGTAEVYEEPAPVETDEQRAAREAAEAEAAAAQAEAAADQPAAEPAAEAEAAPAPAAKTSKKR